MDEECTFARIMGAARDKIINRTIINRLMHFFLPATCCFVNVGSSFVGGGFGFTLGRREGALYDCIVLPRRILWRLGSVLTAGNVLGRRA